MYRVYQRVYQKRGKCLLSRSYVHMNAAPRMLHEVLVNGVANIGRWQQVAPQCVRWNDSRVQGYALNPE